MAHSAFIRFLITVHKTMGVSIITTIECLTTHFASEGFDAGVNANVFLVMFGINKGGIAGDTLVRTV